MIDYIQPASIIFLVGLCLKLVANTNGTLNNKLDEKVYREGMGSIKDDIKEMKGDIKWLVRKNGKR